MGIVRKSNLNLNPEQFLIQIRVLNTEERKNDVQFGILDSNLGGTVFRFRFVECSWWLIWV